MPTIKHIFLISFFVITSYSYTIKVVDGNFFNGTKIYQYKAKILQEDERIIVGKIKVIDKLGSLGNANQDISNYCQMLIYDNSSFNKDRSDITNPNLIWATDFPKKAIISNTYNGYFAIKIKGKDVYVYGLKCANPKKFEQNFVKSNFYNTQSVEQVIGYEFETKSYFEAKKSNEIYDIGSFIFDVKENDKNESAQFTKNQNYLFKDKISIRSKGLNIQVNFYQERANENIDFVRNFINLKNLPQNKVDIKFYKISGKAKLVKPK